MIEYIYIVKCPGCEDEMFNFFTDARMQCDLLMSKKPSITQVEVERNDFGECTDSHDLGTVWSWEEAMKDTESGYTDAEPTKSIFTKDDLKLMADGQDPEFDNLDNSVDYEVEEPETSEVSPVERKPIPEGMTIEQLVEEMEENEDTVECTWCNDLFDKSECRKEVDLGWLCSRCEMAIKSRGETLTFREGNYWDFLDEDITAERSIEELVKDSINHLVNDLGKDPWAEDFGDAVILDIERNYDNFVPEKPENYRKWASAVASEVSRQLNNPIEEDLETKTWICYWDGVKIGTVEATDEDDANYKMQQKYPEYPYGRYKHDDRYWVELENAEDLTEASLSDIAAAANSEFGTDYNEQDLLNYSGVEDEEFFVDFDPKEPGKALYAKRGKNSFGNKKADSKLEDLDPEELHDLGNTYDGGYPAETPEVSDSHLKLCPECGKETFDIETGICVECGFN